MRRSMLSLALALGSLTLSAQDRPLEPFRTETNYIRVDMYPTLSGRPVEDLQASEVEIADQGVGIAHADLERIFERFYKGDRARARGRGGTGLGLAIARHIAERHGGRMWATSEPGKGAHLFLALPR